MLTNFEDYTQDLTFEELAIVSDVCNIVSKYSKSNPIKARHLVDSIKIHLHTNNIDVRFDEVRLRKIVSHVRANGIMPILATSKGYFVSYDPDDVCSQVQSLAERSQRIDRCAEGLLKFT